MIITHETKIIDGIRVVVVSDTGTTNGKVTESTLDYYAQDNSGNVWYMGEETKQIKNGKVVGTEGSWIAGVNGAQPGYIMKAHPKVGDFYCQENAPGVAQDQAEVISVSSSVCVNYICADKDVLVTSETSPLEPETVEHKWYVLEIGNVKSQDIVGGQDEIQLDSVLQT